jgi:predicted metal-dependent phosphoesterase TrpH
MRADLHSHTTSSDGKSSPVDLLTRAQNEGIDTLAITDHDTMSAYEELNSKALQTTLESPKIIPGAEMTAKDGDVSVHLLAYGLDPSDQRCESTNGCSTK